MSFFALLLRNLRYHWRGNLAVFLGVALGSAVLTGALFVGDSLRGSLKALTLDQLGWVEQAMVPGRFFRAALADEFSACPAMMLQGSAIRIDESAKTTRSIPKVALIGVDHRFWPAEMKQDSAFWDSSDDGVMLNQTLADALKVQVGDRVGFNVQKTDAVPRETLLGQRDDVVQTLKATVKAILPDVGLARFTLRPSPEPVRNAFVPLRFLQQETKQQGKANVLLMGAGSSYAAAWGARAFTLEDWNLKLRTPADRAKDLVRFLDPRNQDGVLRKKTWDGRVPEELARRADAAGNLALAKIVEFYEEHRRYAIVESGQMFLDATAEQAVGAALQSYPEKLQAIPRLVYLADSIARGNDETAYAVIAAAAPEHLPTAVPLKDGEIAIVTWPGMTFQVKVGDTVTVSYYVPDERNQLQKKSDSFRVGQLIPLTGAADDPDWTPEFPGITDKLRIADWVNLPFPYDGKRVTPGDEEYWKRYRATPKAYVTMNTGQRLWASRFGKVTSIRAPYPLDRFERKVLQALPPESGGFVFQDVREQALRASSGSADFGVLFLSFSFFLIVAALLLVGLLFRLNIDRRAGEIGLLLATGWSHRQVRGLLLGEGGVLAGLGALAGLAGGLVYAWAMLQFLATQWPGGARLAFLRLHAEPASYAIGYVGSVAVSLLTIRWATRLLARLAPRSLLAGETAPPFAQRRQGRWSGIVVIGSLLGAAAALGVGLMATGHEAKAGSFFGAGAMLLTAALAGAWRAFQKSGGASDPQPSLTRLGMRNAGRHPVRSVLTIGLLASATFLIVAVEAFHKETGHEFSSKHGGSGGFTLIAETDVPVFQDLNDPKTQAGWNLSADQAKLLRDVRFTALRVRRGDDASCLNLYQPQKPRVLGVPARLRAEGRFHIAASVAEREQEKANPWLLLDKQSHEDVVPAILDANTAQWILKVGLGSRVETSDEQGRQRSLEVVALLQESIFQSEMLIAEEAFLRLFPRQEGFGVFLVETAPEQAGPVRELLESALADQGVHVVSTAERLQSFLAVENMYLDTFKALGGLGLLLGSIGLAIVLLRGVWERRGELALLRAIGFRRGQLAWLVLAENALLLALGLAAGTMAALLAVAPHLIGSGAAVLWTRLLLLLGLVVVIGLASGLFAVWGSLRTPVLTALRRE